MLSVTVGRMSSRTGDGERLTRLTFGSASSMSMCAVVEGKVGQGEAQENDK